MSAEQNISIKNLARKPIVRLVSGMADYIISGARSEIKKRNVFILESTHSFFRTVLWIHGPLSLANSSCERFLCATQGAHERPFKNWDYKRGC